MERAERLLANCADVITARPVWTLLIALAGVIVALSHMPPQIDTSTEGLLHDDDPVRLDYERFRAQFGREERITLLVEGNVFSVPFLGKLRTLHDSIARGAPHMRRVQSLVNARDTRAQAGHLQVDELVEEWPEDTATLQGFRSRVLKNPLFRDRLVSSDARLAVLSIETVSRADGTMSVREALKGFDDVGGAQPQPAVQWLTEEQTAETLAFVRQLAAGTSTPGFEIYVAGSPTVSNDVKSLMKQEMPRFMLAAILIIVVVLGLLFRRVSAVVLPIVVVALSVVTTIAIMAWTGTPVKIPTQTLPTFLLVVGVADTIHVMNHFFSRYDATGDKRAALRSAVSHAGLAVALTSLTNIAGLLVFLRAEVAPIEELGVFASVGILLALVFTLTLMPAVFMLVPIKRRSPAQREERWARGLRHLASWSAGHPWVPIAGGAAVVLLSFALLPKLTLYHNPLDWMPADSPVREATQLADHSLGGSVFVEVMADSGRPGGVKDAEFLRKLDAVQKRLEGDASLRIRKATSLTDVVKEINGALHEDDAGAFAIPQDNALIAQELMLFEGSGSDDLEDLVDRQYQTARMTLQVPWLAASAYGPLVTRVEDYFRSGFAKPLDVTVTGMMPLWGRTEGAAMISAVRSYIGEAVVISLLLIVVAGGLRLGMLAVLPNLLPVLVTLCVMVLSGVSLNLFTLLVGTIAVGLCVDDTVHLFSGFRRALSEGADAHTALEKTLATTGSALIASTAVLTLGFVVFGLSSMRHLVEFGLLTALTIAVALVCEFSLSIALLMLTTRHKAPDAALTEVTSGETYS